MRTARQFWIVLLTKFTYGSWGVKIISTTIECFECFRWHSLFRWMCDGKRIYKFIYVAVPLILDSAPVGKKTLRPRYIYTHFSVSFFSLPLAPPLKRIISKARSTIIFGVCSAFTSFSYTSSTHWTLAHTRIQTYSFFECMARVFFSWATFFSVSSLMGNVWIDIHWGLHETRDWNYT